MPKFEFRSVTRPIDLAQYMPEYAGAVVQMWVNAPRATMAEWIEIRSAYVALIGDAPTKDLDDPEVQAVRGARFIELSGRINAWWATMWSQADDPATHWTADEVDQLVTHLADTDPQAWAWLINECLATAQAYRTGERKN
jgi:hypothetical protein